MGLDSAEIESSKETIPTTGLGGLVSTGYGWGIDLVLGQNLPPHDVLRLENSKLFFTRAKLPDQVHVLLGQRDFLERVELRHFNQEPHRRFVIDLP